MKKVFWDKFFDIDPKLLKILHFLSYDNQLLWTRKDLVEATGLSTYQVYDAITCNAQEIIVRLKDKNNKIYYCLSTRLSERSPVICEHCLENIKEKK